MDKNGKTDGTQRLLGRIGPICTLEDLCGMVGCTLDGQDEAQLKIERILHYLDDWNVIDGFSEDRLDYLFSDNEEY